MGDTEHPTSITAEYTFFSKIHETALKRTIYLTARITISEYILWSQCNYASNWLAKVPHIEQMGQRRNHKDNQKFFELMDN